LTSRPSRIHRRNCPAATVALFAGMSAPSPNQIRFAVEPRLVPAQKAARRLHLTEAEFRDKLPALLRAGLDVKSAASGALWRARNFVRSFPIGAQLLPKVLE
jgi:hypothetical protein